MPKTTSFRHMKIHVKSQIVMYVNSRPSPHINLRNLFISLNNLSITYIPFIHLYYIYVWCSWGCGVGVGWGRLGVCGSAVVPPFVVSGWLWSCRVWNTAELGAWGFPWRYSLWLNLHHDIKLKNNCLFYYAVIFWQILVPSRTMNITHEGTEIIEYYCMCIYILF